MKNKIKKRFNLREYLSENIGLGIHTGLRKWVDNKESATAWKAISDMPSEDWTSLCDIVADIIADGIQKKYRRK